MKKIKQPGDNFSLKTKKTEDPMIMQWINAQTNLMDSIRYLIENEIYSNGVRNLQAFIPSERSGLKSAPSFAQDAKLSNHSAAHHETAVSSEPEPAAEEEFDDEDIEAWI